MGRGSGVRTTSATSLQIDFRYKGIRYRERLALAPTPANQKFARQLKAAIEHEIATGTFDFGKHFPDSPRLRRMGAGGNTPLATALEDYVMSLSKAVERETVRDYKNDAKLLASWFPKDKTLATLTRKDVRLAIAKQPLSGQRINNMLRPLRGALKLAMEEGVIKVNPLVGFQIRHVGEAEDDVIDPFSPEEVMLLGTVSPLWPFWAWTGLRSGEVIALLWSDVDATCERISIERAVRLGRVKKTKTKAGTRRLALLPPARALLKRMTRSDGPVFTNPRNGERWHEAKALAREFARACKASGVRYRYPYQLRHTYATWALSSGENPLWIAKQMGHTDTAMIFKHYGKWMPELDPSAGSRMVGAISRLPKSCPTGGESRGIQGKLPKSRGAK